MGVGGYGGDGSVVGGGGGSEPYHGVVVCFCVCVCVCLCELARAVSSITRLRENWEV